MVLRHCVFLACFIHSTLLLGNFSQQRQFSSQAKGAKGSNLFNLVPVRFWIKNQLNNLKFPILCPWLSSICVTPVTGIDPNYSQTRLMYLMWHKFRLGTVTVFFSNQLKLNLSCRLQWKIDGITCTWNDQYTVFMCKL